MDLESELLEKAEKTINEISKSLDGLNFAITGSYVKSLFGGKSKSAFSSNSDIDVAVYPEDMEESIERLRKIDKYQKDFPCFGYDGGPRPPPGRKFIFSELLNVHLVKTLKPEQNRDYLEREGVNYLKPHYFWAESD